MSNKTDRLKELRDKFNDTFDDEYIALRSDHRDVERTASEIEHEQTLRFVAARTEGERRCSWFVENADDL